MHGPKLPFKDWAFGHVAGRDNHNRNPEGTRQGGSRKQPKAPITLVTKQVMKQEEGITKEHEKNCLEDKAKNKFITFGGPSI